MPYNFLTRSVLYMRGCKDDFSMGECYEKGRYVEKDSAAAILCYGKAAQSGNVAAYPKLGKLYLQNNAIARALYSYWIGAMRGSQVCKTELGELASKGHNLANYYLGRVYEREQNWTKAQEYYQRAIAGNDAAAMYRMGTLYQQDRLSKTNKEPVIIANKSQELYWYRKAAAGSKYALEALIEASKTEAEAAGRNISAEGRWNC